MIFFLVMNRNGSMNVPIAWMIIFMSAISLYHSRTNWYLLIPCLIIFYYNYSICMAEYISVLENSYFTSFSGTNIGDQGLIVFGIFNMFFFLVLSMAKNTYHDGNKACNIINYNRFNPYVEILIIIILCIIWFVGFKRPEMAGERGTPSSYFEYSIIFFIIGFYFSGKSRSYHSILYFLAIAYAFLNFRYGGRATGIQIVLCVAMCTYLDRIPRRWLILGGIAVFMMMSLIGAFRATTSISVDNLKTVWSILKDGKFTNDTAYAAYFSSMTFIAYAGECTISQRLNLFGRYLLSIPLGGKVADSNLPEITGRTYLHFGGGVLPFYFYFYLGHFGEIICSTYLFWLFRKIVTGTARNKGLWRCIGIYVASTSFRWYIYSPSQITRGVLLLTIVYAVCSILGGKTNSNMDKIGIIV